jgi:hypothetical protein
MSDCDFCDFDDMPFAQLSLAVKYQLLFLLLSHIREHEAEQGVSAEIVERILHQLLDGHLSPHELNTIYIEEEYDKSDTVDYIEQSAYLLKQLKAQDDKVSQLTWLPAQQASTELNTYMFRKGLFAYYCTRTQQLKSLNFKGKNWFISSSVSNGPFREIASIKINPSLSLSQVHEMMKFCVTIVPTSAGNYFDETTENKNQTIVLFEQARDGVYESYIEHLQKSEWAEAYKQAQKLIDLLSAYDVRQ